MRKALDIRESPKVFLNARSPYSPILEPSVADVSHECLDRSVFPEFLKVDIVIVLV